MSDNLFISFLAGVIVTVVTIFTYSYFTWERVWYACINNESVQQIREIYTILDTSTSCTNN